MRATTLIVREGGVPLLARHRERLAPEGEGALAAFDRWCAAAAPGVWSLAVDGPNLAATRRAASRLREGVPWRILPSPLSGRGLVPKPASPSPYDAVRAPGAVTLLADPDGAELWEACSAALVGWDGARFVCAPLDRPRVASVAEAELRATLPSREAPLLAAGDLPLALINAVVGGCRLDLPGRRPFPEEALAALRALVG